MDFGDWELLSDDGLLDFYEDNQEIISSGNHHHHRRSSNSVSNSKAKSVFQLEDYFSPNSHKIIRQPIPTQFVPVPIHFNPVIGTALPDDGLDEEVTKLPIESSVVPIDQKALPAVEAGDQEDAASSPVFFVKMKETDQFVDMKMDSPKSGSKGMLLPQIDAGVYQFEARSESDLDGGKMSSPRMKKIEMEAADAKEAVSWEEDNGGVNIWKWSLTGIGALCSFGVAAATVCIIIFGSQQHQQNHKPRFQIYTNDKRMKQVVVQATRLNEVISGARGVQVARAHISYGGYYDAI